MKSSPNFRNNLKQLRSFLNDWSLYHDFKRKIEIRLNSNPKRMDYRIKSLILLLKLIFTNNTNDTGVRHIYRTFRILSRYPAPLLLIGIYYLVEWLVDSLRLWLVITGIYFILLIMGSNEIIYKIIKKKNEKAKSF